MITNSFIFVRDKLNIHLKVNTMKHHLVVNLFVILLFFSQFGTAQVVTSWETSADRAKLFQKHSKLNFVDGTGKNGTKIYIDENTKYQKIEGFGWALTEGSAEVISQLSAERRKALLNELFNRQTGIGSEVIRISLGASDLSNSSYSYHEYPEDRSLSKFSLEGPDLTYLIPVLQEIVAINPDIKIIATPWSPPKWMKTSSSYIGGELKEYDIYAKYFIKYFEAMKEQGINIWAITPQNEPHHPHNEPSMYMTKEQQVDFINRYLGPAIANSEFKHVKIIAWDHNCDNTEYPIYVCNNSSYVDGSAFHLYGGDISAMSQTYQATGKPVYFTEQYTGINTPFHEDFQWHMQSVMLGSVNNWSSLTLEWNLAANAKLEPHTPGGCDTCLGALTVDGSTVTRNVSYYLVAQMSKVIKNGAYRIKSSGNDDQLKYASFLNSDGSVALVVHNGAGSTKTFDIVWEGKVITYTLTGGTTASLIWGEGEVPSVNESLARSQKGYNIYPNPTDGYLNIDISEGNELFSQLYSMSGELLCSQYVTGLLNQINLSGMADGLYFLKLQNQKEVVYSQVIKRK